MLLAFTTSLCACSKEEKGDGKSLLGRHSTTESAVVTDTDTVPTIPTTEIDPTTDPDGSTPTTSDDLSKSSQATSSFDCTVETIAPHEVPKYEYQEIKIEDTEIWNKDGLSIHVNGFELDIGTTRLLKMTITNQTGHPVRLNLNRLAVDGFSEIPLWMEDVENGATIDTDLQFFMTVGDYIGDWTPGRFDIIFEVKYTDNESTYLTDLMTVYTSAYDANKTFDFSYGYTFHDANGVKITVLDFRQSNRGDADILLLIENNSDTDILVRDEASLINNLPVDLFMFKMLAPGEKVIDTVNISKDDLESAKITKIETIGMLLSIQIGDDFSSKTNCNPFTISVG
jgi:hypothetical protein